MSESHEITPETLPERDIPSIDKELQSSTAESRSTTQGVTIYETDPFTDEEVLVRGHVGMTYDRFVQGSQ